MADKIQVVYVIGLPQTGGVWICNERDMYLNRDQAYAKVDEIRAKYPGDTTQVFAMYPSDKD